MATRLADAREEALALAEEIAELLEQPGTPTFAVGRTPSPRRITDAEFAEVKWQVAALERFDGLKRFSVLAALAAAVAGGFMLLVRWLTGV